MCRGPLAVGIAPPTKGVTEAEVDWSVSIAVSGAGCVASGGR